MTCSYSEETNGFALSMTINLFFAENGSNKFSSVCPDSFHRGVGCFS